MDQGLLEQGNADIMNVRGISPLQQIALFSIETRWESPNIALGKSTWMVTQLSGNSLGTGRPGMEIKYQEDGLEQLSYSN